MLLLSFVWPAVALLLLLLLFVIAGSRRTLLFLLPHSLFCFALLPTPQEQGKGAFDRPTSLSLIRCLPAPFPPFPPSPTLFTPHGLMPPLFRRTSRSRTGREERGRLENEVGGGRGQSKMEGQSEGRGRVQTGAWRAGIVQGARGGLLHVQSLLRAGGGSRAERVFRSLSGRRRKELLGDRRGSGTRDDDASGGGLTRETAETLIINPPRKPCHTGLS